MSENMIFCGAFYYFIMNRRDETCVSLKYMVIYFKVEKNEKMLF
ncbi:MAG: hypothetical protein BAJALOKI2v1_30024 [Promethearchaeota archaeon]|nr:MAG: hypothetical protein BAJALOKI2v1_30024 [Candidatus Lokiarchaeota archaeon]